MAGRPPLRIGELGKIRFKVLGPKAIRAYGQFRNLAGETRQVEATGTSRAAAERELKTRCAAR